MEGYFDLSYSTLERKMWKYATGESFDDSFGIMFLGKFATCDSLYELWCCQELEIDIRLRRDTEILTIGHWSCEKYRTTVFDELG